MVEVRAARAADARAIARVHVDSWRWAYRGLLPDSVLASLDVGERAQGWERWLEVDPAAHRGMLVAEADGTVVGFCGYGPCRDDDAPSNTGEIYALYRLEDAAHIGVGTSLLTRALEDLRELGFALGTLWVLEGNDRGRRFYEAAGWQPDGGSRAFETGGVSRPTVRYRTGL